MCYREDKIEMRTNDDRGTVNIRVNKLYWTLQFKTVITTVQALF